MKQMRGQLTERIELKAKELLGRDITQLELRLMPYIQYVMTNDQRLDPRKVSGEERQILRLWKTAGYIEGGASGLRITKEFWDIICELVFLGYVDID